MSSKAKVGFFVLALLSMACLAAASVCMAENYALPAVLFFIVSFVLMGFGFRLRKQLLSTRAR